MLFPAALTNVAALGGGAVVLGPYLPTLSTAYASVTGARRMVAGYSGALMRLRRVSDNAEQDFACATGSDLPDYAAISTWTSGVWPRVVKIYDQQGNGKDVVQATQSLQWLLPLSFAFKGQLPFLCDSSPSVTRHMDIPLSISPTAFTIFEAMQPRSSADLMALWDTYDGTTSQEGLFKINGTNFLLAYNGGTSVGGSGATTAMRSVPLVYGVRMNASERRFYCRETSVATTASAKSAATSIRFGVIASSTQFNCAHRKFGTVICSAAISDADAATLQAALVSIFSIQTTFTKRYVTSGDSITSGYNASNAYFGWVQQLGLPDDIEVFNCGVPAKLLSAIDSGYATLEGLLYTSAIPCVFSESAGTNDLFLGSSSVTGSALYANASSVISKAHTSGYKTILTNPLPRDDADWSSGEETQRGNYNTLFTANAMSPQPDALLDWGTGGTMGGAGGPAGPGANSALYGDLLHPSTSQQGSNGYGILAGLIGSVIRAQLGIP